MIPPVLKTGNILIVSVQGELRDQAANQMKDSIINSFVAQKAKGVIIDVSGLTVVDSFLGRLLIETAQMIRILGGRIIICGISPALAITMVELGLPLEGIDTALSLDEALQNFGEGNSSG